MPTPKKVLVFALLFGSASAFGSSVGRLGGTIREEGSRQPLVGATVALLGTRTGTVTNTDGEFEILNIPPGEYDVKCSYIGYQAKVLKGVRIIPGVKTTLNVQLEPTSVVLAPVEVRAERPPIQKDVTGTMHVASSDAFTLLPVEDVPEIMGLQPGVTLESNVRGGKTTETLYLVDGLPVQNLLEGGAGIGMPQSSISEVAVQTGGFEPEYGNALSGVVNVMTRRATEDHRFFVRGETDAVPGSDQTDRRYALDLAALGPVTGGLSYVVSGAATFSDTRWWQDMTLFFDSPVERAYEGFAKLDYAASSDIRIGLQFLGSIREWQDYEYSWRYNLTGLPPRDSRGGRLAATLSQTINPDLFYSVSLSRYMITSRIGEGSASDVDTTMYQWDFFLRYIVSGERSWWAEKDQTTTMLKADVTWKLDEHHMLKAGADANFLEIFSDVVRLEPQVNVFGKPFVNKPLLNYGGDYQYYPRFASAYVQDRLELSKDGMLLNLGIRYDFFDPRAERPLAERAPNPDGEYETTITGSVPAEAKHLFSPRIGFAAPFAERGYLFINYGIYYQWPLFDYLYSGLNNVSLKRGVGALVGNPDLEPEQTRSWEMSLKYALPDGLVLSGTYFNKETTNLIDAKTFVPTNSSVAGDYGYAEFVNNPFARASGLELGVMKEGMSTLTGSVSYTLMFAEAVSENAVSGLEYYQWGIPVPARPFPVSWDERHSIKVVGTLRLPWDIALSGVWIYHSGRPYTYYPSKDGFTPEDPQQEFEPNNARLPSYNLLNLKLSKEFRFGSGGATPPSLIVFVDGRNVWNDRNVLWVDSSGKTGGELGDVSAWDHPRRIRFGVRAEF